MNSYQCTSCFVYECTDEEVQTGAKYYGLHLGRVKVPMEESDPRIDGEGRPPNFYYNQMDILANSAKKSNESWDWVVTYPNDVIGLAQNNFMNLSTPLALYAVVSKELGGQLEWPGSQSFYAMATTFTSSKLHADFCLWAAQEPKASNQDFNVINGDIQVWENLWPKLAKRFGCTVKEDQFSGKENSTLSSRLELDPIPPVMDYAAREAGLKGSDYARPSAIEARIDLEKWSQLPEVKKAWEKVASRHGLEHDVFEKATWGFLKCELSFHRLSY